MQTVTRPEFITSDGAQLRLIEEGPADAPVTVLFVHGWTLSKHSWDRIAAGLPAAAGHHVRTLRFDLRGHGASRPAEPGEATIARCADDLAEIIRQTVERWDAVVVTDQLEVLLGRDLQFIRINGTVVGGLVGLILYTISQAIG